MSEREVYHCEVEGCARWACHIRRFNRGKPDEYVRGRCAEHRWQPSEAERAPAARERLL